METHAKVVVIGGGVVGCSILFHLAKYGLKNCILLERNELTSGSSWHAAGSVHAISSDPNISKLMAYTISLYKEIEKTSGHSVGFKPSGGFYLASNEIWADYLKRERSKARYMGFDQEFISLEEVKKKHPLIDPKHYISALWDPIDGEVDPSGVTYAYAKSAKIHGAKYYTHTPVLETNQKKDGSWEVVTKKGNINAEIVINAGGLWAREVGKLAGINLPVQPMEHHYLITETIPEIKERKNEPRLPIGTDFEGNIYFRQEAHGMLLGTYEFKSTPWQVKQTPMNFGHELLEPKLENIQDRLEIGFKRIPALEKVGIKNIINGPFTFGPDGSPLIGPVPGKRNYWVAVGVMAGFCQAGGVGKSIAEWIIDGEPSLDVWAMDVARFGNYASPHYGTIKSSENYERRFIMTFPNETLPKGRKQKTTALYDRLINKGAVMGDSFGLEQALWFAKDKKDAFEEPTFKRSRSHNYVASEVKAVRTAVGVSEIANFSKHEFTGPGTARHDGVAWGYARQADSMGVDIIQNCEVTGFDVVGGKIKGIRTSKGNIKANKVGLCVAGSTSVLAEKLNMTLPVETHLLQACVSEPIKPILDSVVTFGAGHFYCSQSDKGEMVMGGDLDGYNSYAQRGNLPTLQHVLTEGIAMFPFLSKLKMLRTWGGIMDMSMDGSPIIDKTHIEGLYLNCGWCYGGFKATPASGWTFAHTIAQDKVHELNAGYSLNRFTTGHLLDEKGLGTKTWIS